MRSSINIANRKWKHKDHFATFLGNEAIDWLCNTLSFTNRNDAISVAQVMMDRSIFHHVHFVDTFYDKPTLYRFYCVCFISFLFTFIYFFHVLIFFESG